MAGASFDIVVLSSSPPAHDLYAPSSPLNGNPRSSPRRVAMSASPLLTLSPPVSPRRKTPGASIPGSRKTSIPPDAVRGFATVGSLVRSEHFAQQLNDDITGKELPPRRRSSIQDDVEEGANKKKPKKRSATTSKVVDGDAKPKPKPRSRKAKVADQETTTRDPELRLPAPRISPYFPTEGAEASIAPQNGPADAELKLTKSGKPRKPRAKKEKTEGDVESKPRKPRVTKPKANAKAVGSVQQEDAPVKSAHFRKAADGDDGSAAEGMTKGGPADVDNNTSEAPSIWEVPRSPRPTKKRLPKQRPPEPVVESLELDEAVSRRRDWTPPRDTARASPFTDSVGKENKQLDADADSEGFTHLISNFTYAQLPSAQITTTTATSTTGVKAVMKRRRVELIDLPANQVTSRNSSPEKGKAPKKKPRTITDIATEQYQPRNAQIDPSDVASESLQSRTTVTKVPLNDGSEMIDAAPSKKMPRKRSTSKQDPEKAGSKARSKKPAAKSTAKPKAVAEKLLSPGTALMRMNRQDIMFGTSSQLALEESPTMVRQLQHALKESEVDADSSMDQQLLPPPRWPKLDKAIGKRSLWDASSRDVEGGLLEQVEDVYMSEFDRTQDFPLLMDGTHDELPAGSASFVDIDSVNPAAGVVLLSDTLTPPRITTQVPQAVPDTELKVADHVTMNSAFVDIDEFYSQPPPSNQHVESQDSFADIDDLLPASAPLSRAPPPRPGPPTPTTATGSPKKRRGRPPKSQSTKPTTSTEAGSAIKRNIGKAKAEKCTPAPSATPKRSGRFIDIDEILDSEDEVMQALSPTLPRIHDFSNSQPLSLVFTSPTRAKSTKSKSVVDPNVASVHSIPSSHLEWTGIKGSVFASITAHIRSLLPSSDPMKPTWHEKILMYDPIVLEEFTGYLNTNTNIRTWRRATKIQTKAWNKQLKTIGAEEVFVFDGADEILAVKKELETWQVQAWCESMSVCCIWSKEGRGKSGVRKGFY